jgi:hypothetical protein
VGEEDVGEEDVWTEDLMTHLYLKALKQRGHVASGCLFFLYSADVFEKELLHTNRVEKLLLKNIG